MGEMIHLGSGMLASSGNVDASAVSAVDAVFGEGIGFTFILCNTTLGRPLMIWHFFDKGSSLLDADELLEEEEFEEDEVEDEDEDDWEIFLFRDIFLGAGLLLSGPLRPAFVSMPWNNDIWSGDNR